MTAPAHPYQPGTVWAPKKGKGKPRHIIEPSPVCHGITWSKYAIWYQPALADGRLGKARMCWITTMQDWAGEQVK